MVIEHRLHRVVNLSLRKPLGEFDFVLNLADFLFGFAIARKIRD